MVKFVASAGPRGGAAARDRCDLLRYVNFCKVHANPPYFPVGSIVFPCFVKDAVRKSKGSKGGATVEYSIKTSFMHMKANYALPVDFEAPVMLNIIKPYKGDSDAATSPTQFMVDEWERLAVEGDTEAERLACMLAVLATWLTLRAAHFLDSTVHAEATVSTVILNLDRDKDGSRNVWAGCDAAGQRGPFTWWPAFMEAARLRGYLFPEIELPPSFAKPNVGDAAEPAVGGDALRCAPDSGRATIHWGTKVSSARGTCSLFFGSVHERPAHRTSALWAERGRVHTRHVRVLLRAFPQFSLFPLWCLVCARVCLFVYLLTCILGVSVLSTCACPLLRLAFPVSTVASSDVGASSAVTVRLPAERSPILRRLTLLKPTSMQGHLATMHAHHAGPQWNAHHLLALCCQASQ